MMSNARRFATTPPRTPHRPTSVGAERGEEKAIGAGTDDEITTDDERDAEKKRKKSVADAQRGSGNRAQDGLPSPLDDISTTPIGMSAERRRCRDLINAFGVERGARYFAAGKTVAQVRREEPLAAVPSRLNQRAMGGNGLSRFMRGIVSQPEPTARQAPAPAPVPDQVTTAGHVPPATALGSSKSGLSRFASGIVLPK